jgi:hemerythrin-like domain-containing protein
MSLRGRPKVSSDLCSPGAVTNAVRHPDLLQCLRAGARQDVRHMAEPSSSSPLILHAAPAAGFDQPFEMLGACHDRVRRSLALLQRLAAHVAALGADAQARRAAEDVLRYFDRAAPAHHDDEERHVLPLLSASADAAERELAQRLHEEHERMASAWQALRPTLVQLAAGERAEAVALQGLSTAGRAFAALYAGHLEAEDTIAFPVAAARLGNHEREAMGREMAERRGVGLAHAGAGASGANAKAGESGRPA